MIPPHGPRHSATALASTARGTGHRRRAALTALAGSLTIGFGIMLMVGSAVIDTSERSLPGPRWLVGWANSDEVRFAVHSALGNGLNRLDGPPAAAAMQWVKAAAHARSQADLRRAGTGILVARQRGGSDVDAVLCPAAARGAPSVQVAIALGGAPCAGQYFVRNHVPDGSPVEYALRPPIGGPHYDAWYPGYGISAEPVPPGLWLHNLEHGAVVLLYNCPDQCPELVEQLRRLYAELPPSRNARQGAPRMLMTPYREMERRIAVVAWGYLLELDEPEPAVITQFYVDHVDRGPECRSLACPE